MDTQYHNEEFDVEAQQAARNAVMEIPLFPDLDRELIDALGFGPHCKMLQHFCYWMHPRKPKMKNRWTLYKTYDEWKDECGLSRPQVDKGRKKLGELGLVTEKKGPHGRIHYRIEWVKLAEVLRMHPIGVQTDDLDEWFDPDFDDIRMHPVGVQGQNAPQGVHARMHPVGVHANTGDYTGEVLSGESSLQDAPEPAFAEPGAMNGNGKREKEAPPVEDKRHSQNGHTPSETTAVRDEVEEVVAPPKPDDDTLLDDVREILKPDSGRWWGAEFISERRKDYAPGAVVTIMLNSVEEIEEPGAITEADKTELVEAVRYVMWEAEEEVG